MNIFTHSRSVLYTHYSETKLKPFIKGSHKGLVWKSSLYGCAYASLRARIDVVISRLDRLSLHNALYTYIVIQRVHTRVFGSHVCSQAVNFVIAGLYESALGNVWSFVKHFSCPMIYRTINYNELSAHWVRFFLPLDTSLKLYVFAGSVPLPVTDTSSRLQTNRRSLLQCNIYITIK